MEARQEEYKVPSTEVMQIVNSENTLSPKKRRNTFDPSQLDTKMDEQKRASYLRLTRTIRWEQGQIKLVREQGREQLQFRKLKSEEW